MLPSAPARIAIGIRNRMNLEFGGRVRLVRINWRMGGDLNDGEICVSADLQGRTSERAYTLVLLHNIFRFGMLGDLCFFNSPHALDVFWEVTLQCRIHRGIIHRYQRPNCVRRSQSYGHGGFCTPSRSVIFVHVSWQHKRTLSGRSRLALAIHAFQ